MRAFEKTRGRNKYWHNIVNKHGYTIDFYATGLQEWYAFELEVQLIAYYGRENLCNMSDGGEGPSGCIPSEETRKKQSIAMFGIKKSEETKRNMSIAQKGRTLTEDHRKKISIKLTGKKISEKRRLDMVAASVGRRLPSGALLKANIARSVNVLCCNGMLFESVTKAAEWIKATSDLKPNTTNISGCCSGKRKSAYGYTWRYA